MSQEPMFDESTERVTVNLPPPQTGADYPAPTIDHIREAIAEALRVSPRAVHIWTTVRGPKRPDRNTSREGGDMSEEKRPMFDESKDQVTMNLPPPQTGAKYPLATTEHIQQTIADALRVSTRAVEIWITPRGPRMKLAHCHRARWTPQRPWFWHVYGCVWGWSATARGANKARYRAASAVARHSGGDAPRSWWGLIDPDFTMHAGIEV